MRRDRNKNRKKEPRKINVNDIDYFWLLDDSEDAAVRLKIWEGKKLVHESRVRAFDQINPEHIVDIIRRIEC